MSTSPTSHSKVPQGLRMPHQSIFGNLLLGHGSVKRRRTAIGRLGQVSIQFCACCPSLALKQLIFPPQKPLKLVFTTSTTTSNFILVNYKVRLHRSCSFRSKLIHE